MKATKTCPDWALDLVTQVCKDYRRTKPHTLQWYQSKWQKSSSGYAGWGKIHISAGTDEMSTKLVLLHELAHHITQKRQKVKRYSFRPRHSRVFEAHSIRFWRLAFQLYQRYGVDLEYAYNSEKNYRQKASQAYEELTKK